MPDQYELIQDIAKQAGDCQMAYLGNISSIEYKGSIDIVTDVDKRCEELIVNAITKSFPDDAILAEEGSGSQKKSSRCWIVDPLDGTVNYAHGLPIFCVSIALEVDGQIQCAAIYDPNRDEMFSAMRGQGAYLNGDKIGVSSQKIVKQSLLATGFAYNVHEEESLDNLSHFCNFVKRARAIRRPGSAAIDLAWLASGRMDGFWELFLKPWDMAAGVLILQEAGGTVTDFSGQGFDLYGTEILASNTYIHEEMIDILHL